MHADHQAFVHGLHFINDKTYESQGMSGKELYVYNTSLLIIPFFSPCSIGKRSVIKVSLDVVTWSCSPISY